MGCYNGTCAMTRLPIKYDDDVYVWFFVDNNGSEGVKASNLVYSDDHFSLLGLPFRAKYDDYGGFEDVYPEDEEAFNINLRLIEKEMKDDCPEKPFDNETLLEAFHNDAVHVHVYKEKFQVGYMMVLKPVFDKFLNEYSWKEYVGHIQSQSKYADASFDLESMTNIMMADIIETKNQRNNDMIMAFEKVRRQHHLNFMHYVSDLASQANEDNLQTICRGLYLNLVFNQLANKLRISYGPCSGSGSQSTDYDAYKMLISSMGEIIASETEDD